MSSNFQIILALDVGAQRIGVAEANTIARIAHPLTTVSNTEDIMQIVQGLIAKQDASMLVIGLPRGMQSQETDQTRYVRHFVARLKEVVNIPLYWQDEALTSQKAEAELAARKKPFSKGDVDALAATYILDDFLQSSQKEQA